MASKQKILNIDNQQDYQYKLIAAGAYIDDYQISWAVNQKLSLELSKSENFTIEDKKTLQLFQFSCYAYIDKSNSLVYRLISNKTEKGSMIAELKNIDYFLQIIGNAPDEFISFLIEHLKEIDGVTTVFEIDTTAKKK